MTLTPRNGTMRWILGILGALAVAGIVGWVTAVQATRDYSIRDEERGAERERRISVLERKEEKRTEREDRMVEYMHSIDQRLARIEGKLESGR